MDRCFNEAEARTPRMPARAVLDHYEARLLQ